MLKDLLGFEWRLQTRQAAFVAALFFFGAMGFAIAATGFGADNLALNSPYLVTESYGLISLLSVFAAAIFSSAAVLRDTEHQMEGIVWSTPVGRFAYLTSRFGAAFAAALAAVACSVVGMIVATRMPWVDPERLAPLSAAVYAWPLLTITLPNVLFATAVLFGIAAATRSAIATYAAAVVIYILYLLSAALTNSPLMAASVPGKGGGLLGAILDPFALASFFEDTRYWSVAEKNARHIPLAGTLLLNRLVWLGFTAAFAGVIYRTFSFRLRGRAERRGQRAEDDALKAEGRRQKAEGLQSEERRAQRGVGKGERAEGSAPRAFAVFLSTWRLESRVILGSVPFLLLLLLWSVLAATEIHSNVLAGEYGSTAYPVTSMVVAALMIPIQVFGTLLIIYYGSELFWRERRYRFSPIADAAPGTGPAVAVAKVATLAAMVVVVIAVAIGAGVAMQLASGWSRLDLPLYLSLFYFAGLPLVLFAAATALIHALSPGRYAGLFLVVIFAVATRRAELAGLDHRLWRFANLPGIRFSEMGGIAVDAARFHWFALHWSALAALALLAAGRLQREMGEPVRQRVASLVSAVRSRAAVPVLALVLAALLSGGWIIWNTAMVNEHTTSAELFAWRAGYEKAWVATATLPQPSIASIDADVDLFPEERRMEVTARYRLVNRTARAIDSILVTVRRDARDVRLNVAGATLASRDERFGMWRFAPLAPLAPGAETALEVALVLDDEGFTDSPEAGLVAENGTDLMSLKVLPSIGYRRSYELRDPRERKKQNLPEKLPGVDAHGEEGDAPEDEPIAFTMTLSTAPGQTALTSGALRRSWSEDGRPHFLYVADVPIRNFTAVLSARYAVARRQHGEIGIEVHHDPRHGANVPKILDVAAATLDYCQRELGPYPHRQLRLAEVSAVSGASGFALPGMILLGENRLFLVDGRDPARVDLIARRVAHEVAHQWFGYVLVSPPVDGASMITESLTKYVELMVLERMGGRDRVRQLLEIELDRYLAGRSSEDRQEASLFRVRDEAYVYYGKGALVLWAIRERIGEARLNAALRSLIASGRGTTAALLEELRRVSSDDDFHLAEEWIREIVLYDLRVEEWSAARRSDGRYDVRAVVHAGKASADGRGVETEKAMREAIDVSVSDAEGATLLSTKPELATGRNELAFIVDREPVAVTVDPWLTRVDRNRFDNVKQR